MKICFPYGRDSFPETQPTVYGGIHRGLYVLYLWDLGAKAISKNVLMLMLLAVWYLIQFFVFDPGVSHLLQASLTPWHNSFTSHRIHSRCFFTYKLAGSIDTVWGKVHLNKLNFEVLTMCPKLYSEYLKVSERNLIHYIQYH